MVLAKSQGADLVVIELILEAKVVRHLTLCAYECTGRRCLVHVVALLRKCVGPSQLEAEQRSCIDTSVQAQRKRELRWMDDSSPKGFATCRAISCCANKSV